MCTSLLPRSVSILSLSRTLCLSLRPPHLSPALCCPAASMPPPLSACCLRPRMRPAPCRILTATGPGCCDARRAPKLEVRSLGNSMRRPKFVASPSHRLVTHLSSPPSVRSNSSINPKYRNRRVSFFLNKFRFFILKTRILENSKTRPKIFGLPECPPVLAAKRLQLKTYHLILRIKELFELGVKQKSKIHGRSSNLSWCIIPVPKQIKPEIRILKLVRVCHPGP